jgi:hypothetical protein
VSRARCRSQARCEAGADMARADGGKSKGPEGVIDTDQWSADTKQAARDTGRQQ